MSDNKTTIKNLFESIDNKNSEQFVSYLTDDATFSMGNAEPVTGKENIYGAVGQFFQSIKGLSHKVDNIIEDGNKIVTPGFVTYTRHDDSELTVKFSNVFHLENDKIKLYDVYIDLSELYK